MFMENECVFSNKIFKQDNSWASAPRNFHSMRLKKREISQFRFNHNNQNTCDYVD